MKMRLNLNSIYNDKFPALKHEDFRIYLLGQCVSLMGTWMQNIGLAWLVFSITDSPFLLGLLETIRYLPITLFSLFAGVFIDKYPKRKILLVTQVISMVLAFLLSALVFTDMIRYEYILILALILGFTNTIDMPARSSFTVELTGKEDLMNAVALSSVAFNLARIIGPAIGSLILSLWGADWCFLLNGLSFIPVIASLIRIQTKSYVREKDKKSSVIKEIKDGLKYIAGEKKIIQTTILIIIVGIFVFNYEVLIPVFSKKVLGGGEEIFGLLMSSLGIGSLLGAIAMSMKGKSDSGSISLFLSSTAISIILILIALTKVPYLVMILLIISGVINMWFNATANVAIQLATKDEYRGRVMSVFTLVNSGTAPLGYMFSGAVAGSLGADKAFFICGAAAVIFIVFVRIGFKIYSK